MNILWCGGENIDFPGSLLNVEAGAANFRSGYARHALSNNSGVNAKSTLFPGGAITSAWLSCRLVPGATLGSRKIVGFNDSSSDKSIIIGSSASGSSKLTIWKYDSSWTELAVEAGTTLAGTATLIKIDVQLINYGATATVNVYVDGILALTYSGDISMASCSGFDRVFFGSNPAVSMLSEIMVADDDSRTLSLVTNYPSAAGDTTDWDGAYTDVDETTINDADAVYTDTADEDIQFNLSNLPSGAFSVVAVKIAARAVQSLDASIGTLELGVKSGGTVNVDAGHALTNAWASYERYMPTNPVSTNPWTAGEIDALQLDLQSET